MRKGEDVFVGVKLDQSVHILKRIRERLGIKTKDTVAIRVEAGAVKVTPTSATFLDSYQAISALKTPRSFDEIRAIAHEEQVKEAVASNT